MQDVQDKVGKKTGAVIALAAVLSAILLVFALAPQNTLDEQAVLSLDGLDAGDTVEALLREPHLSSPLVPVTNHSFTTARPLSFPYKIDATVKTGGGEYRDLFFAVDNDRANLIVLADGFSPNDRITLDLDNKTVFDSVSLDWSGKIELKTVLKERSEIRACFTIDGESHALKACHLIPEGHKA